MEKKPLGWVKITLLSVTVLVMIVVGVFGGVGTYSNLSQRYGGETALGALAAGEGATAVLALVLLVTTVFNRRSPKVVRLGLWALPAAAAVMGATAAEGVGQTIVYALTPMAITASAESVAYLARLAVVHQEGRDVEAEARAAAIVRDLAYHQARAARHPDAKVRERSAKKSWRLAAKVGSGDILLGDSLMDIQRVRISSGADAALADMFSGAPADVPALPAAVTPAHAEISAAPADVPAALPAAPSVSADLPAEAPDKVAPLVKTEDKPTHDVRPDTAGHRPAIGNPLFKAPAPSPVVRPAAAPDPVDSEPVPADNERRPAADLVQAASVADAVRKLRRQGVTDPDTLAATVSAVLGRPVKPETVKREIRRQRPSLVPAAGTGQYL